MNTEIQKIKEAIINNLPPNFIITENFLNNHPNVIFVFGDNIIRKGKKAELF